MDIQSIAAVVGLLNIIFLAINFFVVMNVKLAISQLREKIADDRREDEKEMRKYIEARLRQHFQAHGGST